MENKTAIQIAIEQIRDNMYAPQDIKEHAEEIHNDVCNHNIRLLQSLLPVEQQMIEKAYDAGVNMGESYISNWGYDKYTDSEEYYNRLFNHQNK